MGVIQRREFDSPPWRHSLLSFTITAGDPPAITWALLRGLHPFSVTTEPDVVQGFDGTIQLVVSNTPFFVPPTGTAFPLLGDPIVLAPGDPTKAPASFMYNAPFQWIGVQPRLLNSGQLQVHVFASPYSRNFAP